MFKLWKYLSDRFPWEVESRWRLARKRSCIICFIRLNTFLSTLHPNQRSIQSVLFIYSITVLHPSWTCYFGSTFIVSLSVNGIIVVGSRSFEWQSGGRLLYKVRATSKFSHKCTTICLQMQLQHVWVLSYKLDWKFFLYFLKSTNNFFSE